MTPSRKLRLIAGALYEEPRPGGIPVYLASDYDDLKQENERLKDLINHCWVHTSTTYPENQMSTEQKALFASIVSSEVKGE